jgi:hypothetical protein
VGYFEQDVYYQPESFGLTKVGEIDDPQGCYSFDIICVWKHDETGKVYYARDSGCSCPSPFEGHKSLDDLTEITDVNWLDFVDTVKTHCLPWRKDEDEDEDAKANKTQLLSKTLTARTVQV